MDEQTRKLQDQYDGIYDARPPRNDNKKTPRQQNRLDVQNMSASIEYGPAVNVQIKTPVHRPDKVFVPTRVIIYKISCKVKAVHQTARAILRHSGKNWVTIIGSPGFWRIGLSLPFVQSSRQLAHCHQWNQNRLANRPTNIYTNLTTSAA